MQPTDEELLVAGVEDADAFAAFYRRHAAPLAGYFLARIRDRELAADLTAETFAAALAARHRYDATKGSAAGWLYGIAHNKLAKAADRGRVEERARRRLGIARLELDDAALEQMEAAATAGSWLAVLPEDQRAAVKARVVDGRGYDDIAADLGTSPSAIRKRVSRGLSRLRARLEETTR